MSGPTLVSMSSAVESLVQAAPGSPDHPWRQRVAVVTDEASVGKVAVAELARTSATAPDLRQQTEMRIRHCADPAASVRDFVDLTPGCSAESLAAAVDALADDPGCDAILVALSADDGATLKLARAVRRAGRAHPGTAVAVCCSPTTGRHGPREAVGRRHRSADRRA